MTKRMAGRTRPGATAFVLLTVALSWPAWIATWVATGRPATTTASAGMVAAIYAGSFAPGVAAALLSAVSPPGSLRAWLGQFIRWRAYAAALLPLPLVLLALTPLLGYAPRAAALHGRAPVLLYVTIFPVSILNGLATALLGAGPLGEEGGWRGYLLPRLLERSSEARASLIIGVVWGLWHLPIMAMFAEWRDGVAFAPYLPLYVIGVSGLSFCLSRIWATSGGSLVPCIWFHGLVNAVGGVAFDPRLWTSRWSPAAGALHFAGAAALTAATVTWMTTRRRSVIGRSAHR